jgi:hypothetical protein
MNFEFSLDPYAEDPTNDPAYYLSKEENAVCKFISDLTFTHNLVALGFSISNNEEVFNKKGRTRWG